MNSLEFGVGYINGGAHKPIHSSYAAQRVITGLSQVQNMMNGDSPEARAFASYWLDNISFKLQKEASLKKMMGEWTMEDAQEHNMLIEMLHVVKEQEIRANLATPMSEERMPEYVMEQYKKLYPGKSKEVDILLSLTGKKESSPTDEMEELLGFHTMYLNLL